MSVSLLTVGVVGFAPGESGATTAPKTIPLQRGSLRLHVTSSATAAGTSLSGTLGKFRLSGQLTQPNPSAATYVLKGLLDGLNLHVVVVEGVSGNALTFSAKGSVGNKTMSATGALRASSAGTFTLTFAGKIGATKISGRIPLSSFRSVTGAVKVD